MHLSGFVARKGLWKSPLKAAVLCSIQAVSRGRVWRTDKDMRCPVPGTKMCCTLCSQCRGSDWHLEFGGSCKKKVVQVSVGTDSLSMCESFVYCQGGWVLKLPTHQPLRRIGNSGCAMTKIFKESFLARGRTRMCV